MMVLVRRANPEEVVTSDASGNWPSARRAGSC